MTRDALEVRYDAGRAPCARIGFGGQIFDLGLGESRRFPLTG